MHEIFSANILNEQYRYLNVNTDARRPVPRAFVFGNWMLDTGYWMLDAGFWMLAAPLRAGYVILKLI
ncbi:hypothetical protein D3OALGB2SA_519 [Olavius algarvensis associated proteobacterium Delta 3]|nr:hypothetical protein D3OALGB2SA_519 [Olavius algarvensis associated proteobacterium Delta 3]